MGLDVIKEELESMSKVLGLMRGTETVVLLHRCFIWLL